MLVVEDNEMRDIEDNELVVIWPTLMDEMESFLQGVCPSEIQQREGLDRLHQIYRAMQLLSGN